jgi:hypothetical protein
LIHRKVDTEKDDFTTKHLMGSKNVSDSGDGK